MATETKAIAVPVKTWTLIADGKTNVTIKFRSNGVGKVFVGSVIPGADPTETSDHLSISASSPISLSALTAADKVWAWTPEAETLEVLRG